MATTTETRRRCDCLAAIHTTSLIRAVEKSCEGVRRWTKKSRREKPCVLFHELGREADWSTWTAPVIRCALLLSKPGEPGQWYPVPSGFLLTGSTPSRLANEMRSFIDMLDSSAEQRIVRAEVGKRDTEVLFLDNEYFTISRDDELRWDELDISGDRTYLNVPRTDGAIDTIPWDAIRKPRSHLDDGARTKRLLAKVLKTLRTRAGLTQLQAAERSGLDRQTIIRLERGGNYPGVKTLRALAKAYGVKLSELLDEFAAGS